MIRLIILSGLIYIISGCQFADKNDFIFPEGFTGYAAIVYNCEGGISKEELNSRVQLEIPDNGILLCGFERKGGVLDDQFFYMKNGEKTRVDVPPLSVKNRRSDILTQVLVTHQPDSKNLDLARSIVILEFKEKDTMEFNDYTTLVQKTLAKNGVGFLK